MTTVTVRNIVENLKFLEVIYEGDFDRKIDTAEISKPGLELTGFVDYFPFKRVQIIGRQEFSYLEHINFDCKKMEMFLDKEVPLLIFSRGNIPPEKFLIKCKERNIPVLGCKLATSKLQSKLYAYLEYELAAETQVHGVLVSVLGVGVLIQGESGIGKSEVALELIKNGHFLVADDAVIIKRTDEETLIGYAPPLLKSRMEIRGIGIEDIQKLFGVSSVIDRKKIDLVIEMKFPTGQEDRIGNKLQTKEILGTKVHKMEIPITMGRSASGLIEVAVGSFRLKHEYGFDSSEEFIKDLNALLVKENE